MDTTQISEGHPKHVQIPPTVRMKWRYSRTQNDEFAADQVELL